MLGVGDGLLLYEKTGKSKERQEMDGDVVWDCGKAGGRGWKLTIPKSSWWVYGEGENIDVQGVMALSI